MICKVSLVVEHKYYKRIYTYIHIILSTTLKSKPHTWFVLKEIEQMGWNFLHFTFLFFFQYLFLHYIYIYTHTKKKKKFKKIWQDTNTEFINFVNRLIFSKYYSERQKNCWCLIDIVLIWNTAGLPFT